MKPLIAALAVLALTACATPQQEPQTAEQIICADPLVQQDKGGKGRCEAWYAALRGPDNLCLEARSEPECAAILEEIEAMGFSPARPIQY